MRITVTTPTGNVGRHVVEMLVRAVKLGLSCDEVAIPAVVRREPPGLGRALLHILRHATMR